MNNFDLQKRLKEFAHRCVKLATSLPETSLGKTIQSQLIRASTSSAANYRAACIAQSKASFVAKISIALEETDESTFWIEFTIEENLLKKELVEPLLIESIELTKNFSCVQKNCKRKIGN